MQYPEGEIGDVLELRERIAKEIEECEERLEYLRKHQNVLDNILKSASFTKASSLGVSKRNDPDHAKESAAASQEMSPGYDRSSIKRGDATIADFDVAADRIVIRIKEGLGLTPDIKPLNAFFLNRIMANMKAEDENASVESSIDYKVEENNGLLSRIIIRNYGKKSRVKEIESTMSWTLMRMLENKADQ